MMSEDDLEFWKTELEYFREEFGDSENGETWANRFERMLNEIRELQAELKKEDELIRDIKKDLDRTISDSYSTPDDDTNIAAIISWPVLKKNGND